MTLLVLGIDIPKNIPSIDANQALLSHLIRLIPQFLVYALAFMVLGSFWYGHQKHFQYIERVDGRLLWINLFGLMFIALLPFTTNMADGHPSNGDQSALDSIDLLSRVDLYHLSPSAPESRDRCLDSYEGQREKRSDHRGIPDIHWTFVLCP